MLEIERQIRAGDLKVVGLSCFQMEEETGPVRTFRANPRAWGVAMERLQRLRAERDQIRVAGAFADLRQACQDESQNIMPAMMKAVQSYATVGEVGQVFREVFGTWRAPLPL